MFAFSPDGQTIATGGRQGKSFGEGGRRGDLLLWNFASDRGVTPLDGHRSGIAALAFSPDGRGSLPPTDQAFGSGIFVHTPRVSSTSLAARWV